MYTVGYVDSRNLSSYLLEQETKNLKEFLLKEPFQNGAIAYTRQLVNSHSILKQSELQKKWFPVKLDFSIFLSHSHADEEIAYKFASHMEEKFGIKVFVDSMYWGYVTELLKLIDDEYCYNVETNTYKYSTRNYTTSLVYPMLSMALMQMIDNTDVFLYLKSENSTKELNTDVYTKSSWIFQEIMFANMIKRRKPEYLKRDLIIEQKSFSEVRILYDLNLDNFVEFNKEFWNNMPKNNTNNSVLIYFHDINKTTNFEVYNGKMQFI